MLRFLITPLLLYFIIAFSSYAQELNCSVQVNSSQIQSSDKKIFETMQTAIREFMNNRKWTNDQFLNQERIECSLLITVSERSSDEMKATIQVQGRRPVHKSSYYSTLLNFNDLDFTFRYLEYQPLDYNEQSHLSNLTSVLAFYAYIIIGLDYDSFSLNGGTPYFQKAQTIISNAQNAPDKGWKAFEGTRNRYWLVENLLNPQFAPQREGWYKYHRLGLDMMADNVENGRKEVTESLDLEKKVYQEKPGSLLLQVFFNAKTDELINIYSQAFPDEKARVATLLSEIDPSNANKYQKISSP